MLWYLQSSLGTALSVHWRQLGGCWRHWFHSFQMLCQLSSMDSSPFGLCQAFDFLSFFFLKSCTSKYKFEFGSSVCPLAIFFFENFMCDARCPLYWTSLHCPKWANLKINQPKPSSSSQGGFRHPCPSFCQGSSSSTTFLPHTRTICSSHVGFKQVGAPQGCKMSSYCLKWVQHNSSIKEILK